MVMEDSIAKAEIEALLKIPGALKIITNIHACGGGVHPSIRGFNFTRCARFEFSLTDVRHFVLHDVTKLEFFERNKIQYVRAHSAPYDASDGRKTEDWTEGQITNVLRRLQEWKVAH